MELSEQIDIPLPLEKVWISLNDPLVLKDALPGCESFERIAENRFEMVVQTRIGPVSARFTGEVELSDIRHQESYTINGAGKGGVAGFAKGAAHVQLNSVQRDGVDVTEMRYKVTAMVGGKLAQLGSRLVGGAAKKMANEFFTSFVRVISEPDTETITVMEEVKSYE